MHHARCGAHPCQSTCFCITPQPIYKQVILFGGNHPNQNPCLLSSFWPTAVCGLTEQIFQAFYSIFCRAPSELLVHQGRVRTSQLQLPGSFQRGGLGFYRSFAQVQDAGIFRTLAALLEVRHSPQAQRTAQLPLQSGLRRHASYWASWVDAFLAIQRRAPRSWPVDSVSSNAVRGSPALAPASTAAQFLHARSTRG